jgi:formate hydrogenlyase transcriptional activator
MSESEVAVEGNASSEHNRYRVLLEITDLVARAKSLPDAFKELAPPVLALTGGELLNLSLHDPRRDCMLTQYFKKNQESGEFDVFPVDKAASGWAWKYQKPIAIPDTEREPRFPSCLPVLRSHGVRSYTAVPISTPLRHFGALGLGKSVPEALKSEDVEFLSRVALMGALALEREGAYHALQEQQSLVAISRELSSCIELDKLLPTILSSLRSIARYDRAVLTLLDDDGKNVHRYGDALEWESFLNHGNTVPLERSLSAQAVQTRDAAFFSAADLHDMNDALAKAMYEGGIRSVCSVPLIAGNQIWGTLNASSLVENAFGLSEVEYLQQVANQIAAALQNAHAYREIAQLKERLVQEKRYLENEIRSTNRADDIIGTSPALKRVLDYAAIVADTDSTVLITGETGTGKERIARMIHSMSGRKDRNFIKLNCAAIPTGRWKASCSGTRRERSPER